MSLVNSALGALDDDVATCKCALVVELKLIGTPAFPKRSIEHEVT